MNESETPVQGELGISRAGDKLRMAREAQGMSLEAVAAKTRITLRHLAALETSDFASLPSRTYITGFARAYARAVDVSEAEIGEDIRRELAEDDYGSRPAYEMYEPADPERLPSRRLAWTAAIIGLLLISAYGVWRFFSLDPSEELVVNQITKADAAATAAATAPAAATKSATPALPANAEVVITGVSQVWIGFDDSDGKTIAYRTLDPGESYTVPAEYREQLLFRTVRPQALKMTVGGREVPVLGPADTLVKNISLKAPDLMARITGSTAAPATPPVAAKGATPAP